MDFAELKIKIDKAEKRLQKYKELLKKICPHENIEYHPASYEGYYRDYLFAWCECKDCGLFGDSESDTSKNTFNILYNKYREKLLAKYNKR